MQTNDPKQLADQLKCPDGEAGITTAQKMNENNYAMIQETIRLLEAANHDHILEIGPGNGQHVKDILAKGQHIRYYGIDISPTMVEQAQLLNKTFIAADKAAFTLGDGCLLPYEAGFFDKIFTVNTLYFWGNPAAQLQEIHRVLKPGGIFVLSFRSKRFMETLPFVEYNFRLYDAAEAISLLTGQQFVIKDQVCQEEESTGVQGHLLKKENLMVIAQKV